MRLELQIDRKAVRRWHLRLAAVLAQRPEVTVSIRWTESNREPIPACVETVFALERRIHGLPSGMSATESFLALDEYAGCNQFPDLVLDLVGAHPNPDSPDTRAWRLTFDGNVGEEALLAALMSRRMPGVAIVDADGGQPIVSGRPGSETPGVVVAAFEDVLARTISLVQAALDGAATRSLETHPALALHCGPVLVHGARSLARAVVHRAYNKLYRAPHWRIGWRFVDGDGPDVIDLLGLPQSSWQDLPDDGFHFYADPFPIVVDGKHYLFVEDFDHRIGRGVISVVDFDAQGPLGTPRPVLEHDVHLSYPFVLQEAGEHWMIPETSTAGTVELYRATHFPEGWVLAAILLDGIEASDVTPFRHAGRWWLSGTVRDSGSFSDMLYLWSSESLLGPWRAHRRNPVLVDIAAARPAGRVVSRGGRLIRPVQDGRGGYGARMALAEITRLDDESFEQRVICEIGPGPQWPGQRLHTLNRAGRLECIDGSALSPRIGRRRHSREG